MNLTNKEKKIIDYLTNKKSVAWEELAQFSIDPTNVKLKTIHKTISEIKRKYNMENSPPPFDCKFSYLGKEEKQPIEQRLVQVRKTPDGNTMVVKEEKPSVQVDFVLDRNNKSVRTKSGSSKLNDDQWEILSYFDNNPGKIIKISELRDKVKYPNYGSKLPPRWFDAIMRSINGLRRTVPNIKNRLLTTKIDNETSYIYQ